MTTDDRHILFTVLHLSHKTRAGVAFVSVNAILQFFGDIILESLILAGSIKKLPINWAFLALVFISAVTSYLSWVDARLGNVKQHRHEILTTLIIETLLVGCEIENIIDKVDDFPYVIAYRIVFLLLTFINVIILVIIWIYLEIRRNRIAEKAYEDAMYEITLEEALRNHPL